MYNNTIWNFSYYKIETLHANMESKIWDSQSRSSSPQNSIRPPRKKNIPLHTVVVRSLPTFQCFTLPPISPFMLNENFQQNASKFAIF